MNDAQLERFMEKIQKAPIWYDSFYYTELITGLKRGIDEKLVVVGHQT